MPLQWSLDLRGPAKSATVTIGDGPRQRSRDLRAREVGPSDRYFEIPADNASFARAREVGHPSSGAFCASIGRARRLCPSAPVFAATSTWRRPLWSACSTVRGRCPLANLACRQAHPTSSRCDGSPMMAPGRRSSSNPAVSQPQSIPLPHVRRPPLKHGDPQSRRPARAPMPAMSPGWDRPPAPRLATPAPPPNPAARRRLSHAFRRHGGRAPRFSPSISRRALFAGAVGAYYPCRCKAAVGAAREGAGHV